jgi:hypothetical protein
VSLCGKVKALESVGVGVGLRVVSIVLFKILREYVVKLADPFTTVVGLMEAVEMGGKLEVVVQRDFVICVNHSRKTKKKTCDNLTFKVQKNQETMS